jgi:hypothetical protein
MRRTPRYLYQFPGEMVRVRCNDCKRFGQYKKWKLLKILGPGRDLESVLWLIAQRQCRRRDRRLRCRAYFEYQE